jgi:acetyltransferase-like isoleucine patch superfamily enzyme
MRYVLATFGLPLIWLIGAMVGHACLLAVVGVALIIPTFLLVSFLKVASTLHTFGQITLLAMILPFLYYIFGVCLLVVSVICYWLLPLSSPTEDCVARDDWQIALGIYNGLFHICQVFFLRFIRSTELLRLFYIGMGATIGTGTIINTDGISDCDLIDIGKNCIIGADVHITGHSVDGGTFRRGPVKIGNGVSIGQYTTILPNCDIADGVVIGANSLVPNGAILKEGAVYLGVPVRITRFSPAKEIVPTAQLPPMPEVNVALSKDLMTESYKLKHDEMQKLDTIFSQITVASLGLMVTLAAVGISNPMPSMIVVLGPLAGLSYALLQGLNIAMLRVTVEMSKIEAIYARLGVKLLDRDLRHGGLGYSRWFPLDPHLITFLYLAAILGSTYVSYLGNVIRPGTTFVGYDARSIVLLMNVFFFSWGLFSTLYFVVKRRTEVARLSTANSHL